MIIGVGGIIMCKKQLQIDTESKVVEIDMEKPLNERYEHLTQLQDFPTTFIVDGITVQVIYDEEAESSFEELLLAYLQQEQEIENSIPFDYTE